MMNTLTKQLTLPLTNLKTNSVTFWNWSESEMRMNKSEMEMVKGRDIM